MNFIHRLVRFLLVRKCNPRFLPLGAGHLLDDRDHLRLEGDLQQRVVRPRHVEDNEVVLPRRQRDQRQLLEGDVPRDDGFAARPRLLVDLGPAQQEDSLRVHDEVTHVGL